MCISGVSYRGVACVSVCVTSLVLGQQELLKVGRVY